MQKQKKRLFRKKANLYEIDKDGFLCYKKPDYYSGIESSSESSDDNNNNKQKNESNIINNKDKSQKYYSKKELIIRVIIYSY